MSPTVYHFVSFLHPSSQLVGQTVDAVDHTSFRDGGRRKHLPSVLAPDRATPTNKWGALFFLFLFCRVSLKDQEAV